MKNEDGYEILLRLIDDYAGFRERLIRFCEIAAARRGVSKSPSDLADETLGRVAGKLAEGFDIQASSPFPFIKAVALNMVRETQREEIRDREAREKSSLHAAAHQAPDPALEASEKERRLRCLDRCLEELPSEVSELLRNYYRGGEGKDRKAHRRQLAADLGCTPANLRLRAHRARGKLEACVKPCVESE